MSTDSYNSSETVQCVLKCEHAEHFFNFPDEDIFRNLWLYKLGLNNYEKSFRVCNQHFSETMLPSSGELIELAVPDRNLPNALIPKKQFYDQLMRNIRQAPVIDSKKGNVLPPPKKLKSEEAKEKSDTAKILPVVEAHTSSTSQKTNLPDTSESMTTVPSINQPITNFQSNQQVKDWLNDSSTFLMDYQLRVQGKHVCDVVEVPEYVVVFTVTIPKKKSTKNALVQSRSKENMNPLLTIPSTADVFPKNTIQIDDDDEDQPTTEREQTPEIDYVYYSLTEDSVPTREREVQVEMPNNTCEAAIQCDIELDNDMVQMTHQSQVHRIARHSPSLRVGMHECHICGEIMPNYSAKVIHESGHKKCTSLCPRCGEVFSNPIKLKAHESDAHLGSELDIRKALRCPKLKCNKAFHSRKQLNNHINDHMRHVDHKCIKCLRLFNSAVKLNCHLNASKNCLKYSRSKTQRWSRRKYKC